jgi:general nucleoside transport system permease protein
VSRIRRLARKALVPFLSVVTALLFGAIVIVLTDLENLSKLGTDPVGAITAAIGGIGRGYGAMLSGAFGDPGRIMTAIQSGNTNDIATAIRPLTETLVAATPLIFVGLAIAVSFRSGMFNVGGDGQVMMGAMGATFGAVALQNSGLPSLVIVILSVAAGTIAGGAWGFIPGFLKARTGAHEVITTIMLNYVAAQVAFFALVNTFIQQPNSGQPISRILSWANVPPILDLPAIRLDWGFIVALLMAAVVSWLLFRTTKGFELRATGFNMTAARYAGMSAAGSMMLAMSISGALAGMGGAFLVLGTTDQLTLDIGGGIGFNAIALALLAGLRPSGVILAGLLFGALTNGGQQMGIETGIPYDLLFLIMALVIMFVAAPGLVRAIWRVRVGPPAPEIAAASQGSAGTI